MSQVTIYATREEWRNLHRRLELMQQARERAREQCPRTVIIRDGRGGIELFKVINHWKPRTHYGVE